MGEGQFILKGVMQYTMKFYHVLGCLPETEVCGLGDLMRGPPTEDAYTQLKARLLSAHTLTEFQRKEKLLAAQALSGQKPSDMLHDLVLSTLAARADQLWAHSTRQPHDAAINAVPLTFLALLNLLKGKSRP